MRSFALVALLLLAMCQSAWSIELQGQRTQGSLLRGNTEPGTQVWLNGKSVLVTEAGEFAVGFGRDAPLTHILEWQRPGHSKQQQKIELSPREYRVQSIEGLPPKMVSPPEEVLERIRQDNTQVAAARQTQDARNDFMQTFIWPAEGPISGVYGSQRVLNGEPKRPHFGVDVANKVGTPVVAPADGVVTLWVEDMYYSGGTMIIDHGLGVSSTFLHLNAAHVKQGDRVSQGQLVAEIGDTGRVTGAHLDWRLNWFKERLDPTLLVPPRENDGRPHSSEMLSSSQ